MTTQALLVRLEVGSGSGGDMEAFLEQAVPLVQQEPSTAAWFAVRFGRLDFGVFDAFPDEAGREAHLSGPLAMAIQETLVTMLTRDPEIERIEVLADKLPDAPPSERITKALLLTFHARSGREADVEEFLRDARTSVLDEPGTIAWFALSFGGGRYGIFDAFPDNGARFAHLVGRVPRALAKHAFTLLGDVPELHLLDVAAFKLG